MSPHLVFFGVILVSSVRQITAAESVLSGFREACTNEGEEVKINMACFRCICKNNFVECEQESCPAVDDCYFYNKKTPGRCCDKCIGCLHEGRMIDSGTEWTDPDDPCDHYKCVSGVVTRSRIKCHTPCSNPLPLKHGQCCPICLGCQLNGQQVTGEATLSEDPCVKCTCDGRRKLTCMKKSCPVLQCPASKQIRVPGECCARCKERREEVKIPQRHCIIGKGVHVHGKTYQADQCATCECRNGTSYCEKNTCPVLECAVADQIQEPGECCPSCPMQAEFFRTTCTVSGKIYQNGDTWSLSACASCECKAGEVRCAKIQCSKPKCKPNETLVTAKDECCPKCVEIPGVCTVFGDPHYKTFDGNFYSFQGSCKYQLVADCKEHTFSIRVTNDARLTKSSSWTKTVTLKLGNLKVNLGQKMRVKVNGTKIDPPYKLGSLLDVYKSDEGTEVIILKTHIFGDCNSQLNPENYFESCKFDMCECPHKQCYCDSLAAYAHECKRQGIQLPNWRRDTNCYPNATNSLISPYYHLLMQQQQLPPTSLEKVKHLQQQNNAISRPNQRHRKKTRRPKLMIDPTSRRAPPPLFS